MIHPIVPTHTVHIFAVNVKLMIKMYMYIKHKICCQSHVTTKMAKNNPDVGMARSEI